jgi:hypothetical protein
MDGVEELKFDKLTDYNMWLGNSMRRLDDDYSLGYTRVIKDIYLKDDWDSYNKRRFILEKFDGSKVVTTEDKLVGAQYNLVDYNTIGVINEEKLSIYTMQQKIDKR